MTGQTISHYRILAKLGEGAMGVVYRAEDTKLRRNVALKFLPDAEGDAALRDRFLREAQAAAALNHPNICTIFEIDEERGFLAMELVEGPSLKDKIAERPLKLDEALDLASQIAAGLQAAHDKGVTHRDIKPANILLTAQGQVKITDFGLAALADRTRITKTGTSMGTPAYMSPEQAKGEPLDRRTDLWSLGVVLYEMLTGRLPFAGETEQAVAYGVVHTDPEPPTALRSGLPVAMDQLLRKALAKEASNRFQHADDMAVDLRRVGGQPVQPVFRDPAVASLRRQRMGLIAISILLAAGLITSHFHLRQPAATDQSVQLEFGPPDAYSFADFGTDMVAVSPDGRHVAVQVVGKDGVVRLAVRSMDSIEVRVLEGTDGAAFHFWSPESNAIAYVAREALWAVPLSGGVPRTICKLDFARGSRSRFGTWSRKGLILIQGGVGEGLYQVSASGGSLTRLTTLDATRDEIGHFFPVFLPDGNHFLYARRGKDGENSGIHLGTLDTPQSSRFLIPGSGRAWFIEARPGLPAYILYSQASVSYAQPFDMNTMSLSGDPVQVPELRSDRARFGASPAGVLAYFPIAELSSGKLAWFTRSGAPAGQMGPPGDYRQISLSRDASTVAVAKVGAVGTGSDIWAIHASTGAATRLTFGKALNCWYPVWSPDDSFVFYHAASGRNAETRKVAVSSPGEEQLVIPETNESATLSPGSHIIVYAHNLDLWAIPASGKGIPFRILDSPFVERHPQLSQDGRLLAYTSDESGQNQVHVMEFGEPPTPASRRWQASVNGGSHPRWSRDGRELFYLSPDRKLMAVTIQRQPMLQSSAPVELFQTPLSTIYYLYGYDVAPNGRFLMNVPTADFSRAPIRVITNWRPQMALEGR
jgi:Tol biopolymer transport system component